MSCRLTDKNEKKIILKEETKNKRINKIKVYSEVSSKVPTKIYAYITMTIYFRFCTESQEQDRRIDTLFFQECIFSIIRYIGLTRFVQNSLIYFCKWTKSTELLNKRW